MEKLYQDLFDVYKSKSVNDYEKKAIQTRTNLDNRDFHFEYESFIPYPSYKNRKFNEVIYKKQEFYRNKSRWEHDHDFDEIADDKCKGEFRSNPSQKFIKNFMSPLTPYRSLLIYHGVGTGKCLAYNTPVLMFDGSIKKVQDITEGELIMGDDSTSRTILSLARGKDMMYDIRQENADTYRVNSEHILVLKNSKDQIFELEVCEFLKLPQTVKDDLYGYSACIEYPERETETHPYDAGMAFEGKISNDYLINSIKNRFKYLLGITHQIGKYTDEGILINHGASDDLEYLGRSLGFSVVNLFNNQTLFKRDPKSKIQIIQAKEDNYYGFVLDGNRRFLLGDFTVTHNTCTAINVAEQYYDTFERRILVVLSGNIEENFKKQIYDINKLNQCTGTKYPDMVLDKHILSKELLEKKIDGIIKQRYEFMGYKELANYLEVRKRQIGEQIKDPLDPKKLPEIQLKRKTLYEETVRDKFSNRLIIVDEAHNLRLSSEKGKKQISAAFLELMQIVENTKLILMTATPMYNIADEIVWMMNLLRTNDRESTIKRADIFDKESNLTEKGKKLLTEVSRGYVSYMRGENPYSFPFRMFPSINNPKDPNILRKYPKKDIYGELIPQDAKVKFLEIIVSQMSDYQYEVYNSFKRKIKEEGEIIDEEIVDENADTNDVQNTMQLSNTVYPCTTEEWKNNSRLTYGMRGFTNCFDVSGGRIFRVKYKEHIKSKYGEFLSYSKLDKYAPKIKRIIDYIKKAKGIIFIYSRYYGAGLFPLACALEHVGMTRYSIDGKARNVMENITVNDQFDGKRPKYVVLSTKDDLSPNNNLEIELAKSKENTNGELIKVIIVSKIGTEGIDFKKIREVHILEPWYNLNRAEQIIGRAVRTCSHIDLPKADRNVTIYFHANICREELEEESVDLRTYRISETKQKKIIEVEDILKKNSVDCSLNKKVLMFIPSKLNTKFDIETSQGKVIKNYQLGDKDNSFICGFRPCSQSVDNNGNFVCETSVPEQPALDNTTFDTEFILDDIQLMKKYIASLYQDKLKERTYKEILKELLDKFKMVEEDIVNFAIEDMINNKYSFKVDKDKNGYLMYRSDKYIFQYESLYDIRMTLEDREELSKKEMRRISLNVKAMKKVKPAEELIDETVEKEIKSEIDMIYNDVYKKMTLFFFDIETSKRDISGIKEYLESVGEKREMYEQIIYDHIENNYVIDKKTGAENGKLKKIKAHLTKYEKYIYDSILDRLNLKDLFKLLKPKDDKEKNLKNAMTDANLLIEDYVMNPIDKKLYKLKANKIVACSPADYVGVKDKYTTITEKISDKLPKNVKMYTIWQKDRLVFKIRETSATMGSVCGTSSKKDYLIDKMSKYMEKELELSLDYQKAWLCMIIEILSRKTNEFQRALYIVSKT